MPLTLRSDTTGTFGAIALDGTDRLVVHTDGTIEFNGTPSFNSITLTTTPSADTDAANKNYVDNTALALSIALS